MLTYSIIDLVRHTTVVKECNHIKREIDKGYDYLENYRQIKLTTLFKNLLNHPFYKDMIGGYDEKTIVSDPYKILSSLPLMSKLQISNYDNWFFEIQPKNNYEKRFTGGSTGTPFTYYLSKYSISRITGFNYFLWYHFLGFKLGDKILSLGGDSLGQVPDFKTKVYNLLQRKYFVPGDIINKNVLSEGLKLIFEKKYDVIYAYTSPLEFFVDEAIKRNLTFKYKIKGIITVSEMLSDKTLQKFKNFFKCDVLNCYGARDGGLMAGEVKSLDAGFYFNFYDCIVESKVVDQKLGKSELILTNLGNYSFPFVRYRVGDIGTVEPYNSTFHLPLSKIVQFEGRTRDLVYTHFGGVVHGSAFNAILKSAKGIDNYQIVQNADLNLEVRIKSMETQIPQEVIIDLIRSLVKDPEIDIKVLLNHDFVRINNQKHKIIVSYVN